jgi:hypothetical protein
LGPLKSSTGDAFSFVLQHTCYALSLLGSEAFPEDPGDGGGRKQPGIRFNWYVHDKTGEMAR